MARCGSLNRFANTSLQPERRRSLNRRSRKSITIDAPSMVVREDRTGEVEEDELIPIRALTRPLEPWKQIHTRTRRAELSKSPKFTRPHPAPSGAGRVFAFCDNRYGLLALSYYLGRKLIPCPHGVLAGELYRFHTRINRQIKREFTDGRSGALNLLLCLFC